MCEVEGDGYADWSPDGCNPLERRPVTPAGAQEPATDALLSATTARRREIRSCRLPDRATLEQAATGLGGHTRRQIYQL